jgi:hypothetical protein
MSESKMEKGNSSSTPICVDFEGRNTGLGAYTKYRIFSLRKNCEVKPHRTEYSRTGNHWVDYWWLLPGKYFIAWQDISNSGKHYCGYGLLVVGSPFVQLKSGEIKFYKSVSLKEYFRGLLVCDGEEYRYDDVIAYSRHSFGIAKWFGDVPEFAKDALCRCISPRPDEIGE